MIDFGLSQRFLDDKGTHIKKVNLKTFTGNILFASLNSCRGFNKSRRDDIESIFYNLIFMLNDKSLPWSTLAKHASNVNKKVEFSKLLEERLNIN